MKLAPWFLVAVLLTPAAFAQTPIPTVLLEEQPVAKPVVREAPFAGSSAVATNGETFLVVTAKNYNFYSFEYAVMIVDRDGEPLLEASYTTTGCGGVPDVASDGRGYLVVFGCHGRTSGLLVSADGSVRVLSIHETTRPQVSPHDIDGRRLVAWDGRQYVVITTIEQRSPTWTTYDVATRISAEGEILQNDVRLGLSGSSAIAAKNGVTVVASTSGGLAIQTMNSAGVVSDPLSIGSAAAVALAAGDDGFLLIWSDEAIRGWHLDPSGAPDRAPFTVSSAKPDRLAVTAEGTAFRAVWRDAEGPITTIQAGSSGIIGAASVVASGGHPDVASNQAGTLVVWSDDTTRTRRLGAEGDARIVHRFAGAQRMEALAFGADGPMLSWGETVLFTTRTSHFRSFADAAAAAPLGDGTYVFLPGLPQPLIITGSAPPYSVRYPGESGPSFTLPSRRIFWTGSGFLAVWTERAPEAGPFAPMPLLARRFDATGKPIDDAPRVIGTSLDLEQNYVSSAALNNGVFGGFSGGKVLIAYVDPTASLQGVLLDGDAITPLGEIAPPQALANPIAITSDGTDFLVSWISGMAGGINAFIASRRVLANGEVPFPIALNSPGDESKDAMATFWTGQNYLVVWATVVDGGRHLSALRLSRDGKLLDYPPQPIGFVEGTNVKFAYRNGVLAVAYDRGGRGYWRAVATPRRRAVGK
ncbi:MAG: hypothetical protein WA208_17075 [Thermoanaerobaculia bacterium]